MRHTAQEELPVGEADAYEIQLGKEEVEAMTEPIDPLELICADCGVMRYTGTAEEFRCKGCQGWLFDLRTRVFYPADGFYADELEGLGRPYRRRDQRYAMSFFDDD